MTDKISDEDDDFPRDTCFTCNVSPTAAERSGRQWAIDTLRAEAGRLDEAHDVNFGWRPLRAAADFLESRRDLGVSDLRQKLAAEIHSFGCGCDEPDAQSLNQADAALAVFAEWLREQRIEGHEPYLSAPSRAVNHKLDALADSITTPKGEHGGS